MGKVFAVSDLHGQYDLFKQIRAYLGEDDICYVLGDCVDRGDKSIAMLLEIIQDKRFIMLKGNHEQMIIDAFEGMHEGYMDDCRLWYMNGGRETHDELIEYSDAIQHGIMTFLRQLPSKLSYVGETGKTIVLSHAGFDWSIADRVTEDTLLWDRSHLESKVVSDCAIQVHGHTPCQIIVGDQEHREIVQYAPDKICIDIGACFIGRAALLDLDTLKPTYFSI